MFKKSPSNSESDKSKAVLKSNIISMDIFESKFPNLFINIDSKGLLFCSFSGKIIYLGQIKKGSFDLYFRTKPSELEYYEDNIEFKENELPIFIFEKRFPKLFKKIEAGGNVRIKTLGDTKIIGRVIERVFYFGENTTFYDLEMYEKSIDNPNYMHYLDNVKTLVAKLTLNRTKKTK